MTRVNLSDKVFSRVLGLNYKRVGIFRDRDGQGRYGHFRYWLDNYFPGRSPGIRLKAQVFNAPLPEWAREPLERNRAER